MTLAAHNTADWSLDRIQPYFPEITAAMLKLERRYPNDVTTPWLAQEIMTGQRQLWLILEGEQFVSFFLTEIKTNNATGYKVVCVTDLAGGGGTDNCPLTKTVEEWARGLGADEVAMVGRLGWRKAMAKEGYQAAMMTYRKPLREAAGPAPCIMEDAA